MALSLRGTRSRGKGTPKIPTASMGDIAFLIMIFFFSASIFSKEKGLKIVLPEAGAQVKIEPKNILDVGVNASGQALVGNVVVSISEVSEIVKRRLDENPELAVALRVSRKAPYQSMIQVFDQLKLARAQRISLISVAEEAGGGP